MVVLFLKKKKSTNSTNEGVYTTKGVFRLWGDSKLPPIHRVEDN